MRRVVLALFVVLVCSSAFAQQELVIDLKDGGTLSTRVPPGQYTIRIINRVPNTQYNVTTEIKPIIESPVSIAEAKRAVAQPPAQPPAPSGAAPPSAADCTTIVARLDAAIAANDGGALATLIAEARQCSAQVDAAKLDSACERLLELAKTRFTNAAANAQAAAITDIRTWADTSRCPNVQKYAACLEAVDKAKTDIAAATTATAIATTTEVRIAEITAPLRALQDCDEAKSYLALLDLVLDPVAINQGEMLTVTIVRASNSTTWVRNFTTGKRGEWLASYGVLLVPNRDANYSSYHLDGDNYVIRRSRDREAFDYIPTLTFTFMRPKDAGRDWFDSPVFGIGYDLQSISATAGWALTYNHNFAISGGVMLHQQRRLKGKYEENEHYTKSGNVLENSDLTELTWAPNVYFGITIRSLTNPFAR